METSILISVKKTLGLSADYDSFDEDVIIHINSALAALTQLGVGPEEGFAIDGETQEWDDIEEDPRLQGFIKTYIFLKVSLSWDPPAIGYLLDAKNNQIKEHEFRITVVREELLNAE